MKKGPEGSPIVKVGMTPPRENGTGTLFNVLNHIEKNLKVFLESLEIN